MNSSFLKQRANGLITDKGLAIYLENHYGCVRNVSVMTDLREPFNADIIGGTSTGTSSKRDFILISKNFPHFTGMAFE